MITHLVAFLREDFPKLTKPYKFPGPMNFMISIVHKLTEVRGSKTVLKYLTHHVEDLENLVELISNLESSKDFWGIHYILLLWLSMVVIVPFDLDTIDSKKEGEESLLDKIMKFCEGFINSAGKNKDAASSVLAKLFTRPDVIKQGHLDAFIEKMKNQYTENLNDSTKILILSGTLHIMCDIFSTGQRKELYSRVETVFDTFIKSESETKYIQSSSMIRQYRVKFAHKLGLIYLKPRVASWRYQMGSKSLLKNLENQTEEEKVADSGFNYDENEDDIDSD